MPLSFPSGRFQWLSISIEKMQEMLAQTWNTRCESKKYMKLSWNLAFLLFFSCRNALFCKTTLKLLIYQVVHCFHMAYDILLAEIASPKHVQSTLAKFMLKPPRRHARSAHMDNANGNTTTTAIKYYYFLQFSYHNSCCHTVPYACQYRSYWQCHFASDH